MTTYKVGYIVGSLATASLNRTLAKALVRLAPPDLEFAEIPIKDLPVYSYDYDSPLSRRRPGAQARSRVGRRSPVRNPRIQPLHSGRAEKRHRLGEPPARAELVRGQALGRDRRIAGQARDSTCPTEPARRAWLPQLSANERAGGIRPTVTGLITEEGNVTDVRMEQFLQKVRGGFRGIH